MAVDRKAAEDGLDEIIRLYRTAQREIAGQVREALLSGEISRRVYRLAAYGRVTALLTELGIESDPIARRLIQNAWIEGDQSVLRDVRPDFVGYQFDVINREALREAQDALMTSLGDARQTVGRQVFDVYRRAGLQSTTLNLLGAKGSGRKMSADLVQRLQAKSVKSFTDKLGRQWDLRRYAEMVSRTTTREAVVQAQIQRMAQQGIELARISRSGNPCPICAEWQGRLISLDGKRASFDGEQAWRLEDVPGGGPPLHPNCRHYLQAESILFANVKG